MLNKLAIGLSALLPALLGPHSYIEPRLLRRHPVASRRAQPEWRDPDSGYLRRTLTPSTAAQPLQLHEARLPAGGRITLENAAGQSVIHQQIWILAGRLEIRVGAEVCDLREGDCMAMRLETPASIHNPGRQEARWLLAFPGVSR